MKIITRGRVGCLLLLLAVFLGVELISLQALGPTEKEWLRARAGELANLKITPEMIAEARPWDDGKYYLGWWKHGFSHVIPLGDGGAVYVVTHSFHDMSGNRMLFSIPAAMLTGRRPVMDATIAVDQEGRLYTCEGHVCGGLHLSSKKKVLTLQDFLESCSDGKSENTWKPYHPE